jgi:MFS family permease
MTALLGVAIASLVIGTLSDKVGRRPCVLACLYASIALSMIKYFARASFWGFCAANFANGLFSATLPLAMAYMGDVFKTKEDKQMAIGMVGACNMIGTAGGGVCAILMESQGLFVPLWIGVGLMILSSALNTLYLIEPDRNLAPVEYDKVEQEECKTTEICEPDEQYDDDDDDEENKAPDKLDNWTMWNIIVGAFADNVGTAGLNPLCLSPLAFIAYYKSFVERGLPPIMSLIAYKVRQSRKWDTR